MSTPREFVDVRPNRLFFKHILRKVFLEDWHLKLTALLITFALWYGVSVSSKKGTATMAAQLAFRVSDDTVLMSAGVQDVTIRVAGNDKTIDQLFGNDIRVTADLTQVPTGDRILQLTPQSVSTNLPSGVRIEDIQPSRIAVKLDQVEEKDVSVDAAIVGEPAAGFEIYSTSVTPAKVRIRGPESFMSTLESVPTGPVDISGAKSDVIARQVPLAITNNKAAVFNTVVDVTVLIGEKRIERIFALTTSGGKRVSAVLFGPRSVLSKVRSADLKAELRGDSGAELPLLVLPEPLRGVVEIRDVKFR
jgi:YbbR domain-containing protein